MQYAHSLSGSLQTPYTLASLRMEKALVCGELSEEEGMLQLERAQLSDISDMTRNRDEEISGLLLVLHGDQRDTAQREKVRQAVSVLFFPFSIRRFGILFFLLSIFFGWNIMKKKKKGNVGSSLTCGNNHKKIEE